DAAVFPRKTELPMIGGDCDQEKADDWYGDQPGQQSDGKTKTAHELHDADDVCPKQRIFESNTCQKLRRRLGMSEQNWKAVKRKGASGHHAHERFGNRRGGAVNAPKCRYQEARLVHDDPHLPHLYRSRSMRDSA